jgi:DNA-binding response OmpR family regulator
MEQPNHVHTRQEVLDKLWKCKLQTCRATSAKGIRAVDDHVYRLRQALGRPDIIRTVFDVGYGIGLD